MAIDSAYDRVLRILILSIGIGSAVFTLLGLASMIEQHPTLDPVFSYPAYLLFCVLPPALAVVALRAPVPLLRVLAGVHALSGIVILLFWYPLTSPDALPVESVPWIMNTIAVAACTAAVALPALWSWVYLAAVAVGSGVLRFELLGATDALTPFQDALMIALFGVVMVSLVQLTLRSGRVQDAASLEAQLEAATVGAAETAQRQRTRYQDFTRNDVIATLHEASIDGPDAAESGARASRALAKLDEFTVTDPTPPALHHSELSQDSASLRLTDGGGRALLAFYGAGTAIVAVLNLGGLYSPALGIVSVVMLWVALILLAVPGPDRLSGRLTAAVIGLTTAMSLASSWNIVDPDAAGYSAWHLGAITFVLLVLALRGRRSVAWIGFATLVVITLISTVFTGEELLGAVNNLARQAGTLAIGTLFAVALRRAGITIAAIHEARLLRSSQEAATASAAEERSLQTARLERDARPALERLMSPVPLGEAERRGLALLAESLRDGITAAGFSGDVAAQEIRSARARGIRVALIDDRGAGLEASDRQLAEDALVLELRRAKGGTVTARLSPLDSEEIASVVVDDGEVHRSVIVRRDATQITR